MDNSNRAYNFSYDQLSRLREANYTGQANEKYGTSYSYDKQGNILTLKRLGKKDAGDSQISWGVVDQLSFTYNGNQLKSINDTVRNVGIAESADFKSYAPEGTETHYTFNRNGAMTQDLNKGITNIEYNSLNLPISMDISNGMNLARNEYLYAVSGVKLQVKHSWNKDFTTASTVGSGMTSNEMDTTKVIDYVGNKIYENGELKKILVDGGYYDYEKQEYFFYIQDHLGNNRVVVNQNDSVVQRSDYYPFGMEFADNSGNDQPYKYNGKELDKMHGLNMYDYSARYVDPAYGRFTSVDPLAEKYYSWSPYVYVMNNPLRYVDPTGMDTTHVDRQGNVQLNLQGGDDIIVVDEDLPEVVVEAERIYPSPDYVGINYSGSAILGVGVYGDVTIGIISKDGLFIQFSGGFGMGLDISHSINYKQGNYSGNGKPTATSLEGYNQDVSIGGLFLNGGYSEDRIETKNSKNIVTTVTRGEVWQTGSAGVTIGSKSVIGGHAGLSNTFGTIYLYKK